MCVIFEFSILKFGCHLARLRNNDRYVHAESFNSNSEKDVLAVLHQCGLDLVGCDFQLLLLFCF